jgi:thiol-disulfide isomerase/thioredoxin
VGIYKKIKIKQKQIITMKRLAILALLVVMVFSCKKAPTQFTISGTVDTIYPIEEVVLYYKGEKEPLAKAKIVDGKFTITGTANEPRLARLLFGKEYRAMVLENADYEVVANDNYKYIKGGNLNDIVFGYGYSEEFKKASKDLTEAHAKATKGLEITDLKGHEKARKIFMPYSIAKNDIKNNHFRSLVEGEASTQVKLFALTQLNDWDNYGFERKLELLNEYEKDLPNNKLLISMRKAIQDGIKTVQTRNNTKIGQPFIDFTATTIDNKSIALSDVVAKNKYTLIEFWASWCGPCRASFPHLKEVYAEYKDKGLEVYGLSLDTKKEAYLKASKEEDLPWINAVDYDGHKAKAAQDYAVVGIPYTILISQEGKIVAGGDNIRGILLDEKLKELFK